VFNKILIANRGEIACRVMKTARKMGILTVAVYSDADVHGRHVAMADEAICIGPAEAAQSYLSVDAILDAAQKTGVEAIHPGYGFLSENPEFADATVQAGMVFIGPPPMAMREMGSKDEAKKRMIEAGVPVIPGYHGDDQSVDTLKQQAEKTGFPVLLKAAAGGGGKGMRVVQNMSEMDAAITGAKREGEASFGSGHLLIEKYFERARHVEVQIFADKFGNAVHLFERDCSLQRRHQKVIEEAPAPNITPELRQNMGEAAVRAAKAVDYQGAGTVEFLLGDDERFYFLEMNTRLQVEHPVTEMITDLDLVEWQFRVAAGQPLPLVQSHIRCHGHAMEARIYAEDPANDFLPAPGTIRHLRFPDEAPDLRIETGTVGGDTITPFYDPMIAKIVVHGDDRESALKKLKRALSATEVSGIKTNIAYLKILAGHDRFENFNIDTGFIDRLAMRHEIDFNEIVDDDALVLATLAIMGERSQKTKQDASRSADPYSPWVSDDGWRILGGSHQSVKLQTAGQDIPVEIRNRDDGGLELEFNGNTFPVSEYRYKDNTPRAVLPERTIKGRVIQWDNTVSVYCCENTHLFTLIDDALMAREKHHTETALVAPMPGKIVDIPVKSGQRVVQGDLLMVIEAMKMEHSIVAHTDGLVESLYFKTGDQVTGGDELFQFKADGEN